MTLQNEDKYYWVLTVSSFETTLDGVASRSKCVDPSSSLLSRSTPVPWDQKTERQTEIK